MDVLQSCVAGLVRFGLHATDVAGTVQGATLRSRHHRSLCPLVRAVSVELPELGRNHGGTESQSRSRDHLALGPALCAGTEPPLPARTAEYKYIVARRRDVLPCGGQVDLFISGGR